MADFIGAVATGCALGAVFIAAKQAICKIIPQKEPAMKLAHASDQWRIVAEGVLALDETSYQIRLDASPSMFRIFYKGECIDYQFTLEKAKQATLRHMKDMIEMGVEP
jgi:hypothetical protein